MLSQHILCICKDKYLILTVHFYKGQRKKETTTVVGLLLLVWFCFEPHLASHTPAEATFPIRQDETQKSLSLLDIDCYLKY